MSGLDIFAWIVLVILIVTVVAGFIILAMLPGKIAKERGHPQHEAINVAGWLGAIFGGIFWPFALIWAFTKSPFLETVAPDPQAADSKEKASA